MRFVNILASAVSLLGRKSHAATKPTPEKSECQPESLPVALPVPQTEMAQHVAEQLLGQLQPLWLKRHGLDLDVRFAMGKMLWEGLYPSGQDRLPYGSQVMNTVGQRLGICRPDLHRMVKVAREFKDLAAFQAKHPGVTTWDGVKKLLAQTKPAPAGSAKPKSTDASKLAWRQVDKQLSALKATLTSVPQGSKRVDAEKRQSEFQAVSEEFHKLLANATVTPDDRDSNPS